MPLNGIIRKPTGKKDLSVQLAGTYIISWNHVSQNMMYTLVEACKPLAVKP